jgi:hypothetical protein
VLGRGFKINYIPSFLSQNWVCNGFSKIGPFMGGIFR